MRKNRLNKRTQEQLMEHFVSGTTARFAAELIGSNRKSSAHYYQRFPLLIAAHTEQAANEAFAGESEMDESYFGGHRKSKRGRGSGANKKNHINGIENFGTELNVICVNLMGVPKHNFELFFKECE